MKLYLFSLIIFIICKLGQSEPSSMSLCDKKEDQRMDSSISKIITVSDKNRKFPEDYRQVIPYCKDTFKYINEAKNYIKKCLNKTPKQVASVLIFTLQSQARQLCSSRSRSSKRLKQLLSVAPCANSAKELIKSCSNDVIDSMMATLRLKGDKTKMTHLCCEKFKIDECLRQRLSTNKNCNDDQIEEVLRFLNILIGDSHQIMCPDSNEERCERLERPKIKSGGRRPKSYVMPLIEILSSLTGED